MKKSEITRLRKILEEKRESVIRRARETMENDMALDVNELPDEMDLASSEYMQSFTLRLRGRERVLLQKIDVALKKMETDEYGMCVECEEPISVKRLEARPETELCIRCKEDQERQERDFT
ncbi:MAG: TraR/DksA C4-type zinc finger protein [Sandaracinaceae bacterium]|jgi:DnaK suppressor protein|nr:TraR/DksA C4-type zinc finger protein [Sandaracinaceae bacterium]MBK6810724.1 TraR/DksA C4-type zinc finger protein [Sandaracinaceae bacterium]MBK7155107.1 TraR/DksA C4-type zinc finger protein [Sandaracinaceae bacterium]MBK7774151.1 TraR/DksA C4-type zinc finger protein [Sandaracinaceae bacterium]MBK8409845.1 TraR/DksA C4-type zinc finger protein [Sandaracinaceae bacterium]